MAAGSSSANSRADGLRHGRSPAHRDCSQLKSCQVKYARSALKSLLNALAILVAVSAPSSAKEQRVINEQFHISVYYPDSWSEITSGVPNEIFRLWSTYGKGTGGCTIAANDTKICTNTDESIVEVYELVPQVMEARLLEGFIEPKVLDRKITTPSNLKAISIIADGTYSANGQSSRRKLVLFIRSHAPTSIQNLKIVCLPLNGLCRRFSFSRSRGPSRAATTRARFPLVRYRD
jgi:hypothetical protein